MIGAWQSLNRASIALYKPLRHSLCKWSYSSDRLQQASNQRYGSQYTETKGFRRPFDTTSSIARQIQQSGELPALPNEPIVNLPPLSTHRVRPSKIVIRDDLGQTIEAQHALNTLAHGNIHLNLQEDISSKSSEPLGVTPPKQMLQKEETFGQTDTALSSSRIRTTAGLGQTATITAGSSVKKSDITPVEDQNLTSSRGPVDTELRSRISQLSSDCDSMTRLEAEINNFCDWVKPTSKEHELADRAWQSIKAHIQAWNPDVEIELHGSRATGLARPLSDIDIRITIPGMSKEVGARGPSAGRPQNQKKAVKLLQDFQKWLRRNQKSYRTAAVRKGAKIPVVDIESTSGFKLQLGAMPMSTAHATEYTKYLQSEYPQAKSLFLLARWWIEGVGLGDSMDGGISAYPLFNMVLISITHSDEVRSAEELGPQLLQFFKFWADADWKTVGFAADPARTFSKIGGNMIDVRINPDNIRFEEPSSDIDDTKHTGFSLREQDLEDSDMYVEGIKYITSRVKPSRKESNPLKSSSLILQDPADPRNNLGRAVRGFDEVQSRMSECLKALQNRMRIWDRIRNAGANHEKWPVDLRSYGILSSLIFARKPDAPTFSARRKLQRLDRQRAALGNAEFHAGDAFERSEGKDVQVKLLRIARKAKKSAKRGRV